MLKKLLPKSPLGIVLTAAAVILYASPEARKAVRKAAVKGLSALMALTEQLKESTSSIRNELSETMHESNKIETKEGSKIDTQATFTYNTDIEPEDFLKSPGPLNVMNDEYLKKHAMETSTKLH